jgi:hypothetical protein
MLINTIRLVKGDFWCNAAAWQSHRCDKMTAKDEIGGALRDQIH